MPMKLYELAEQFDLTEDDLRHYQHAGLLRSLGGIQSDQYNENDVLRLSLLVKGEEIGFSVWELKEIIDYAKWRKVK